MRNPGVLLVGCLLVLACGGDDGGGGTDATSSGTDATGTTSASSTTTDATATDSATASTTSATGPTTTSGGTSTGSSGGTAGTGGAAYDCQNPGPGWLYCEDFEAGAGDWDTWLAQSEFISGPGLDDRGRVDLSADQAHAGGWSAIMPAAAASGYQGASLDWFACDGDMQTNCPLRSYDELYFRTWVRFQEDHQYVHHFLTIAGSQPDDFWYHGTAGCLPNGELAMSTTVDFTSPDHRTFFYQYHPDMSCDTNCGNYADVDSICQECANKGLPTCTQQPQCCWGNNDFPDPDVVLPVGEWFCLEMYMKANDVGSANGEVAYWLDDQPGHTATGLEFRTVPELALNRMRVQHYITTDDAQGHSNVAWFDDVVVSTERIGCQ